ncbi:hypothetical protein [Leisingera aquaemixtae]|uniref:Uncharacterized protein n=1 Tax=Leisingera aquaemixtae TaxID=1396826 RepID=A0A0P1HL94_9RHOB|nr:hypothetical protein [Leisingera aquaemixtae]CUH99539.1 hypothetical protein PHA8399_01661 [Leisingera aquaemixtae]
MTSPARQLPGAKPAPDALHQALRQLAQPVQALTAQAQRAAAGQEPLLPALLREIGETVLPREITLCIGQTPAAVLTAAHRRLAGLSLGGTAEAGAAPEDPAAAARLFAARLRRLEAQAASAGITFRRRPCAAPQGAGSCTAAQLQEALAAASRSPLGTLRSAAAAQALAWIHCPAGAQAPVSGGPAPLLQQLQAVRSAFAASAARPGSARMPAHRPDCLLLPVSPNLRILAAAHEDELLLLALPPGAVPGLIETWDALFS